MPDKRKIIMNIRTAVPEDAPSLIKIYAPYVLDTSITFEYEVPSREEFAGRIRSTLEKYPYLVAEDDGDIRGYAYASPFKSRAAYDWSVETSIYIHPDARHRGVGTALYSRLEELLHRQRVCNLCACITYPNPVSISFHERFGYKVAAHFNAAGFKLGSWHDIVWMEKELCPHDLPPLPFVPFSELNHT